MRLQVCAFADEEQPARRLAKALDAPLALIDLHRFPDGESLPTVPRGGENVLFYRSLDQPDGKVLPLLLACDAFRRAGVRRLVLVAPYLCYLRQDALFAPGQPLSRDVVGAVLGPRFDRIVTVEPHLHRTRDIGAVFSTEVTVLSAAKALADAIGSGGGAPLLIGPDEESEPWTAALGAVLGAPHLTFRKTRQGDRSVELVLPDLEPLRGRRVVLVDDICSSGATLAAAAKVAVKAGAAAAEAAVVHALFDRAAAVSLAAAGITRIISTDSCAHPTNAAPLVQILAESLLGELGK